MARRKFGWHTPDVYEEADTLCRPLFVPLPFIHIVGGALSELTRLWNWEQVGSMTPETATEIMSAMLKQWYEEDCVTCCPLRINPQTGGLQFSEDDGETWQDVDYGPNVPGPDDITFPDPAPQPEGTDEEQRCVGARNAALVLQATYQETVQVFVEGVGSAVLGLLQVLSRIVDLLLGGRGAVSALVDVATGIIAADADFVPDGFPDADLEAIQNLLYCFASVADDVVTFDYAAVIAAMEGEGAVEPFPGLIVLLQLFLGADGLNAAGGVPAVTEADCSAADCVECESYADGFDAGLGPLTALNTTFPALVWQTGGAWQSSGGRTSAGCVTGTTGGSKRNISLVVDLGMECNITNVAQWVVKSAAGASNGRQAIYDEDLNLVAQSSLYGGAPTVWTLQGWTTGGIVGRYVQFDFVCDAAVGLMDDISVTVT